MYVRNNQPWLIGVNKLLGNIVIVNMYKIDTIKKWYGLV